MGGLVKSVDAAGGVIVLTTGAGPTLKTVTIHVSPTTVLKRYAPGICPVRPCAAGSYQRNP